MDRNNGQEERAGQLADKRGSGLLFLEQAWVGCFFSGSPLVVLALLIATAVARLPVNGGDARQDLGQRGLVVLGRREPVPLLGAVGQMQPDGAPRQEAQPDAYAGAW